MDIQFDINGQLVIIDELAAHLSNPMQSRALKQMASKIEQEHCDTRCAYHEEPPVVAIIVRDEQVGARVSACCQTFVDQIQLELRPILAEAAAVGSGLGTVHNLQLGKDTLTSQILRLTVPSHQDRAFEFEINRINRLTVGRLDAETGRQPDIDFANFNAQEKGVSRLHATLIRENRVLFLVDEGSPNGTWINEQRLLPKQPYALKNGDTVYFGQLCVSIHLARHSAVGNGS